MARSDDRLDQYQFELSLVEPSQLDAALVGDQPVYKLDATPLDNAPVVWGKEEMLVRADYVLLRQVFFDQSMQPVKEIKTLKVEEVDGRVFASQTMVEDLEEAGNSTLLVFDTLKFDFEIPDDMFTTFELSKQFVQ